MAVSKLIVRELLYTWRLNLRGKILNCLLMQPSTILMNITKLKYHVLSCGALELKGSSRDSGKQKKKGKSTDVFSYLSALGSACILCYLKQVFQEVLCEFVEDLPASLR